MQVIQYLDRDDYELDEGGFSVWSAPCNRWFYGQSLGGARNNRSESERVLYQHRAKGNG